MSGRVVLAGSANDYLVGETLVFDNGVKRPWYKRAWIWFKVKIIRRRHPDHYTVTAIMDETTMEVN